MVDVKIQQLLESNLQLVTITTEVSLEPTSTLTHRMQPGRSAPEACLALPTFRASRRTFSDPVTQEGDQVTA